MSPGGASIAVIVPVYNGEPVVTRCLDSVLGQDIDRMEVVVIDDGSTDGSWDAVSAVRDRRLVADRRRHDGVSSARNMGARLARAPVLTFLDCDDEAMGGWLDAFMTKLADPRCAAVCCGVEETQGSQGRSRIRLPVDMGGAFDHCVGLFLPGSYAVRRDVFDAIGGFDRRMSYGEHHELALRLISYCRSRRLRIEEVRRPLVHRVRSRPPRERLKSYRRARYESTLRLVETHREQLGRSPERLSNHLANGGLSAVGMGERRAGRRLLREAIRVHPGRLRNYSRLAISFVPPVAERLW